MTEDKERVWQIVYSSPLAEAKYWTDPSISHEEELLDKLATLALRGEYLYRPDLNFWIGCLSAAIRTIRNEKHEITSEDIRKFKRYEILEESHPENPENIDREMLLHNAEFIYTFCHYLWNSPEEIKKRETKRQIDGERHQRKQSLFLGTTKNNGETSKGRKIRIEKWKKLLQTKYGYALDNEGHILFDGSCNAFLQNHYNEKLTDENGSEFTVPSSTILKDHIKTKYNGEYGLRSYQNWYSAEKEIKAQKST